MKEKRGYRERRIEWNVGRRRGACQGGEEDLQDPTITVGPVSRPGTGSTLLHNARS